MPAWRTQETISSLWTDMKGRRSTMEGRFQPLFPTRSTATRPQEAAREFLDNLLATRSWYVTVTDNSTGAVFSVDAGTG